MKTTHAFLGAAVAALAVAATLLACTAGDELSYRSSTLDAGTADVAAARVVGDSTADVPARVGDGAVFSTFAPIACNGLGTSCDPTAGLGCCLRNLPGNVGADNLCIEQVQHSNGSSCGAQGDVFLGCLASDTDSTCCWHAEADGTTNTRYRTSCTGGVEACDPSAVGGGACATGGPCTAVLCKGVTVGYCGAGAPPCQP